jgi:hypothetical protein
MAGCQAQTVLATSLVPRSGARTVPSVVALRMDQLRQLASSASKAFLPGGDCAETVDNTDACSQ